VLVVACTVGGIERKDDSVDLQCRLIRARDPEEAYRLAMDLGREQDHAYDNADGEVVRWQFKGLHRLEHLEAQTLEHGTEVYSSLVRTPYRDLVSSKEQLWEFWLQKNRTRRVIDALEDE
jgi:hypothetical protein